MTRISLEQEEQYYFGNMINTLIEETAQHFATATEVTPCVSVTLPFEPKMQSKSVLQQQLHGCYHKVMKQLHGCFAEEAIAMVGENLMELICTADYSSYRKGIAFLVSPDSRKTLYLDIDVRENIIIDSCFEIRDLVYSKKDSRRHLVVALAPNAYRVMEGSTSELVTIISDTTQTKLLQADNTGIAPLPFLHYMDVRLKRVLQTYPFPLFITGDAAMVEAFRTYSSLSGYVIDYIHNPYNNNDYLTNWQQATQKNAIMQLHSAMKEQKLECGADHVWKAARQRNAHLLVVEKDYAGSLVDTIIETVLMNGGDVELVNKGALEACEHMALIKNF